jgi:hypothetical protein
MADELDLVRANISERELLLGAIIIARGVCEAEATEKGVSFEQAYDSPLGSRARCILLVTIHHDDREGPPTWKGREVRALARLGIA